MNISTTPDVLKNKKITLSIEVTIPVLTCKMCGKDGEFYPNHVIRSTYDRAWDVNGMLYPQGWLKGHCETCKQVQFPEECKNG